MMSEPSPEVPYPPQPRNLSPVSSYENFSFKSGSSRPAESTQLIQEDGDLSLDNWNRWLKIHKKQQNQLSDQLKRHPQCLVMNANYSRLGVNQEKHIISEASKIEFCDKYRGPPDFWKTDDNFRDDGKKLASYQPIQQRLDRSQAMLQHKHFPEPEKREYVGVPNAIYQEKGLDGKQCLQSSEEKWQQSKYVQEKMTTLEEKIKIVVENKPDFDDMIVLGTSLKQSKSETESKVSIPEESCRLSDSTDLTYSSSASCSCSSSFDWENYRPTVSDFGISITVDREKIDRFLKPIVINFKDCFICEKYQSNAIIKNTRDASLRYFWKMVLPHWADHEWPLRQVRRNFKCFFFDKMGNVILPADNHTLVFYFQSNVPGVFVEKWELYISHEPDSWTAIALELHGVAKERDDSLESIKEIDSYLDCCTNYTITMKTLKDVLDRSRTELPPDLPYSWKFFEEEIFVHNNPDFFYDNNCVLALKNLHTEVFGGPWDYSLNNLRDKLMQRINCTKDFSGIFDSYSSTVYKLMKPSLPLSLLREKQKLVYKLLSCFANQMETQSINLKLLYKIQVLDKVSDCFKDVDLGNSADTVLSGRLTMKPSILSKQSFSKNSRTKSKGSLNKTSKDSAKIKKSLFTLLESHASSTGNSVTPEMDENEIGLPKRKQKYLDRFYISTYHLMCQTVDNISAVIDSFDAHRKRTILDSLKKSSM